MGVGTVIRVMESLQKMRPVSPFSLREDSDRFVDVLREVI
jgi:hypothetical protein